ncbi:hypothetical protein BC629DRAFT_1442193 [Irpex lacteus]|nr:hypothetical protein BC629DRAFT_1442193 [Irpex lacteus]
MSSITELQQELIGDYINQSSNEVNAIWSRKWTATTWLYVLTRYGLVIDVIVLPIPPWSSMRWRFPIATVSMPCMVLCTASLRSAGRQIPSSRYSSRIESCTLCYKYVFQSSDHWKYTQALTVSLITRISVIFGDTLVLAVTWTKSGQAYREARQLNIRAPLATILFRDGTIYFLILLMVNVLQMVAENVPAGNSWIGNPSHSLPFIGNIGQSLQFGAEDAGGEGEAPKIEAVSAQTKFSSGCAIGAVAETANANKESRYSMGELEAQPVTNFQMDSSTHRN